MSFDLYTISVECMIVRCKLYNMKVQTIQNISCNFREKIQNIYLGPDSIVVELHFLKRGYPKKVRGSWINFRPG